MGGIPTDISTHVLKNAQNEIVEGLFAAGECACVSTHGANRLGTNSTLECCVFGRRAGISLLRYLREDGAGDWRERAELLLAYLDAEERCLHSGDLSGFALRFFNLPAPLHRALTRAVGRSLGSRLHAALLADALDPIWLRALWFESFNLEGSPLRRYMEALEQLGGEAAGALREQPERL
jgi:succinate dehydrogenase/fumarate reductase flavoprotein subunit